jgi:PAS domain S-box-containing protein
MAIIVARDVSQQRAADQQMQLLASLVENSADLQGAVTASGELLYLNRTGRRLAGIESPAEPLGSALRFFDELDQPQVLRAIAEVAAGRERLTDLEVTSTASGLRIPMQFHSFPVLDARQEVVAVGTIARDLSDARRVERELRDRVQFQELIGGISALLFNTGPEDADAAIARVLQQLGTYSDADLAFVGRIDPGTARFESLHQSIRAGCKASVPLRDLANDAPAFWRVLQRLDSLVIDDCQQLGPGFEAECELLRAHGVRALLLVPIVMERRLNAVVGVSCAGGPRNFSPGVSALLQIGGEMIAATLARHAAAAELLGYSEALEALVRERTARIQVLERQRLEGEKLAATGRMSARIAHEINNPLAGIKNSFRLVRAAIPAAHPDAPYADRIDREIDRIANIVRQMYDLYRPERERPRRFQLAEALRDVVLLLEQNWLRAGISIDWSCRPEGLEVELAAMSLRQVLFNLLANAIEASPRGGRIAVKAELEGGEVLIEVLDQGNGIPEWAVDQIFEPFFTTKHTKDGSGLGLGLSVSRGLVEAMGGTLGFVSSPGHGTTFTIRVPLAGQRSEGHDEH